MGCVSGAPSERESVNTQSTTNSMQSLEHIGQPNSTALTPSDTFHEPTKIAHRKKMNTLQLNRIHNTPKPTISALTHDSLREHTMRCEFGSDSSSISTDSSTGERLKNIGDELLSMEIKKNHLRKASVTLSETPIPNEYSSHIAAKNRPKYHRIASESNQMKIVFDGQSETDSNNSMDESGGNPFKHNAAAKSLNFPDVLLFTE